MKIESSWSGLSSRGKNQHKTSILTAYTLAFAVLFLDQLTKFWIEYQLRIPGNRIRVVSFLDFFNIVYVQNPGAAWGILEGHWYIFILAALIAAIVCVSLIHYYPDHSLRFPLALVLGGALGNLIDRIFIAGGVVDFLDFGIKNWRWPAFNVADAALTLAVIWLLKIILFSPEFQTGD